MKYDQIAEAYIYRVLENQTDIPVVDISHHKQFNKKCSVDESMNSWINDDPEEYYHEKSFKEISRIPYYEKQDKHETLAKEHGMNLQGNEDDSIRNYITGGLESGETGSRQVNMHLIDAHKNKIPHQTKFSFDDGMDGTIEIDISTLDSALKRNKLKKQLITYSGLGFNPAHIMQGNKLHLPAYTSSTTHRGVSLLYAVPDSHGNRHVMQIKHPKGSTGFYVGDNEDYSPFNQKEHIMPRGVTLQIDPEPEIHEDSEGKKLHVWKAKRMLSMENNN